MAEAEKKENKQMNCHICGRFTDRRGKCPKVFWDDWMGAWEHG